MSYITSVGGVSLAILVNSREVDSFQHLGRFYVEGRANTEYSIKIRNNNGFRVKVVLSVDSVSVLTGKPASSDSTERGYIVNANDDLVVRGYRLDNSSVAAFKFVEANQSYAKQANGMEGTTGVIGLRAWREKEATPSIDWQRVMDEWNAKEKKQPEEHHHHWWYPSTPYIWPNTWYTCGTSFTAQSDSAGVAMANYSQVVGDNSLPQSQVTYSTLNAAEVLALTEPSTEKSAVSIFTLGSTFGSKQESKVEEIPFETGTLLGSVEVFYLTRNGLKKLGVPLHHRAKVTAAPAHPQSFDTRYCTPPSGWVG